MLINRAPHGTDKPYFSHHRVLIKIMLAAVLVFSNAGCATVGPDYVKPETAVPETWTAPLGDSMQNRQVSIQSLANWWKALQDPILDELIEVSVRNNLDHKEALARLRQARAQRSAESAGLFPELDAGGSVTKSHSENNSGSSSTTTTYNANLDASWEIDIFGGLRRSVQAAQAELEAAQEDVYDVLVSLCSEVALNYIQVRTTQARIEAAQKTLEHLTLTYELEKARNEAGISDALSVQQAYANLESTRASIPSLQISLDEYRNALAVLLGQVPGSLTEKLMEIKPIPSIPAQITIGIPADALRNRPDIREAEQALIAQTAQVGVATAELYPKLTLNGSLGSSSTSSGDLFKSGSKIYSYGPSISWALFRAGAVRAEIEAQKALQEQTLYQYQSTVLSALEEAENAISAYNREQIRLDALQKSTLAAQEAQKLAEYKYNAGMVDFDTVLDAQKTLTTAQDTLAQSKGSLAEDLVRLYKALGGGWSGAANDNQTKNTEQG